MRHSDYCRIVLSDRLLVVEEGNEGLITAELFYSLAA